MFKNLFKNFAYKEISGLTDELKALYVYDYYLQTKNSVLIVTDTVYNANKLFQILQSYTNYVCLFPMDDILPMMSLAMSPEFKISRLETINSLINMPNQIIITNLTGYLKYIESPKEYCESTINIKVNDEIDIKKFVDNLLEIGYTKETIVNKTGELAVRGFIVDIFPITEDNPYRIEFWGDQIDSIRIFDIDSQRTIKKIDKISIKGTSERTGINANNTILNYLMNPTIFYNSINNLKLENDRIKKELNIYTSQTNQNILIPFDEITLNNQLKIKYLNDFNSMFSSNNIKKYESVKISKFQGKKSEINKELNKYLKKYQVIICMSSRLNVNKLIDYLKNQNFIFTNENNLYKNKINIIIKDIHEGFIFNDKVVISENEIFNRNNHNIKYKTNFKIGTKIKNINKLNIGDYIVHINYGVGIYCGIKTIPKNGINKDYLQIKYKGNDKLYIPVEKIDLISKYSAKEGTSPKLNKLGSVEWEKTKIKVKKKIESIAEDLLELYAKRQNSKGFAFDKDNEDQINFEKEFPHTMTIDQLRVTEEIKKDMESSIPMDRLLCGDVGFGKTEVAFRAIFKAILSGKQAAILCPTTILSSQHYNNALERFSSYPVNIEILNRFVTGKKAKEILQKLKEGKIDLLIGTHRILSDDVVFKDLGLLVIDEEQRFGVKHKEKIKSYKNNVDVLTLSATPIPRTLQMSMTGIRGLSLLETPPTNRLPIQTYIMSENDYIIKDAIYKELLREGQCFILNNRVENMNAKMDYIKKLVPEARITFAHGKMSQLEIESIMTDFINYKYDILICTTIIETGIDIPRVNTLIILDADNFGLSQLYQIRGRVGRSDKIAYCYLMYSPYKQLNDIAVKRLNVIKEFTELGSGFAIAMRDLSIRGAGDILGSEQAGFIDTVGIDLFLKMLDEQVKKLRGEEYDSIENESPQPLINVETTISDEYVDSEELKIEIHQKINSINSLESLNQIKDELEDRFGKLDDNVIIYMYEEWFEKLANKYNIKQIRQTSNFIEIVIDENILEQMDGAKLFRLANEITPMFRFKQFNKNVKLILDTVKLDKHFIYYLVEFFSKLDLCKK